MPYWIYTLCERAMAALSGASPTEFGRIAVAVVVLGWSASRFGRV
jgi:hypothetical protein